MNHTEREINTVWRSDIKVGCELGRNKAAVCSEKFSSWSQQRAIQLGETSRSRATVSKDRDQENGAAKSHVRCVRTAFVQHRISI